MNKIINKLFYTMFEKNDVFVLISALITYFTVFFIGITYYFKI